MAKGFRVVTLSAVTLSAAIGCGSVGSLDGSGTGGRDSGGGHGDGPRDTSMDSGSSGHDASEARDAGGGGSLDAGGNLDLYRSGTRIKMKVLTSPDGAKVFQGNYDSQRGEDCNFQTASDGVSRCLPTSIAAMVGYFGDAACSIPIALATCQPEYVYAYTPVSTCPSYAYGAIFRATLMTTATFYLKVGAACTAIGALPSGQQAYVASGTEIMPSNFQSATMGIE